VNFFQFQRPQDGDPKSFTMQLLGDYVAGISMDFSLCKVFNPPIINFESFWTGFSPLDTISPLVRFLVVHKCRPSASNIPHPGSSFQCEDTRHSNVRYNEIFKCYSKSKSVSDVKVS